MESAHGIRGVVNPAGDIWYPSREAMEGGSTIARLRRSGESIPLEKYAQAREFLRPNMISLVECRKVLLDGPIFQNSPAWNIHPLMCEDMVIRNITVLNPWYSQNGDGLDLDSCRRVVMYDCRFDVGDDAMCIKSGLNKAGRLRARPCEDISISDCIVYHGHGDSPSEVKCPEVCATSRFAGVFFLERIWDSDLKRCAAEEELSKTFISMISG